MATKEKRVTKSQAVISLTNLDLINDKLVKMNELLTEIVVLNLDSEIDEEIESIDTKLTEIQGYIQSKARHMYRIIQIEDIKELYNEKR